MFSTLIREVSRFYYACRGVIAPALCVLCTYPAPPDHTICHSCKENFPILPHHCIKCARFLFGKESSTSTCGHCLISSPYYDRTFAAYPYASPIEQMILQLKFGGLLKYALALSELLIDKIRDWYAEEDLPQVIIPVPLHRRRMQERGFNQALEIAKPLSKKFKIPINRYAARRDKYTAPQSRLSAAIRNKNIRNAFNVQKQLNYHSAAVIDDVMTTGATVNEFCKILKQNGIKHIDIWCCARRG